MRTPAKAAAILAVVSATTVGLPAASANAAPRGNLVVCTGGDALDLYIYADGPSFRTAHLAGSGEGGIDCTHWYPVRVGRYDVGLDIEDIIDSDEDEFEQYRVRVRVIRNGHTAMKNLVSNGLVNVATSVVRNRTTKVIFNVQADDTGF